MQTIAVDFESFYAKKLKYGIKELGAWHYCHHDLFDPFVISVSDGESHWAGHPSKFNWEALDGATLLSHNRYFDSLVYSTMVERGLAPQIKPAAWHCTANLTSYLCNRRALDQSVEFLLGVKLSKATRDYANGKHWADIVADGRGDEMLTYARSDSVYCHQLWTRFGHLWPAWEQQLSDQTIRQGQRGIKINVGLLNEYIAIAQEMVNTAESALPWRESGRPPTSPKAIAEECRREGIPCPPVKSRDGEEAFLEWEAVYSPRFAWVANVSNWRSINKFLDSLLTIKSRLTPEDVFPFGLKYFGAHTGRWSGDAGFNVQNMRKVPLYRDGTGFLISDVGRLKEIAYCEEKELPRPAYVTAVLDIRKLFIPRPGKKMIMSDLRQIEPRVLAWLVQDEVALASMREGKSPYFAHALSTMGFQGTEKDLKAAKDLYALAKARVLALGFGCGWKKFIVAAQVMAGLDITIGDPELIQDTDREGNLLFAEDQTPKMVSGYGYNSKKVVAAYRSENPKIAGRDGIWRRLDNAFKLSVGQAFELELPSGRKIRYCDVRNGVRQVLNEDTGLYETQRVTTADIGGRRFPLYGGALTENLVQGMARDIFGLGLLRLEDMGGVDVLFSEHDGAINEVDADVTVKDIDDAMTVIPEWCPGLPIQADTKEVPHYCK